MTLLNEVGCIRGGVGCKWLKILILSYPWSCQLFIQVWERILGLKWRCGCFQHRVGMESWTRTSTQWQTAGTTANVTAAPPCGSKDPCPPFILGLTPRSRLCWLHVLSHALIMCSLSAPDTRGRLCFSFGDHMGLSLPSMLCTGSEGEGRSTHIYGTWHWWVSCSLCPSWIQSYVLLILLPEGASAAPGIIAAALV